MNTPAVARLLQALDSGDPNERASAALELASDEVSEAKPQIRSLCSNENDLVATTAMYACWKMGEDHIDARRIVKALGSADESTMQLAVNIVTAIGAPMVEKLAPFLDATADESTLALRALDEIHVPDAYQVVAQARFTDSKLHTLQRSILDDWADTDDEAD